MPPPTSDPIHELAGSFSWSVLLGVGAIFAASLTVFLLLARRWTTDRRRLALDEWAEDAGYGTAAPTTLPPSLAAVTGPVGTPLRLLSNGKQVFARIDALPGLAVMHVLVRPIENTWPATGLRPTAVGSPVIERLGLTQKMLSLEADRFTVVGTDADAGRSIFESSVRALLPADLGLVLTGNDLLLDFSARPFDPIELSRVSYLTDQLIAHLPRART